MVPGLSQPFGGSHAPASVPLKMRRGNPRRRMIRIGMRRALRSSLIAVATLLGGADVVWGSAAPVGAESAAAATFVRVAAERGHPGVLYAGIGGEEIQI